MPYSVLALLAPWIGSRGTLVAAVVVLGIDLASGVAAMTTSSSTGAVVVLLGPMVSMTLAVPTIGLLRQRAARTSQ